MSNPSNVIKVKTLYHMRPYHNWEHIEKCLWFLETRMKEFVSDELSFAVVYHDVIYNPSSKTNEEDSISVAKLDLSGMGLNLNKIESLILATKHVHDFVATDDETQCMLDVDLSILGSAKTEYHEYVVGIREEYSFVDYTGYSRGRIEFLQKMLSRKRIFYKLVELESIARTNLYDEIVYLSR
jgi:predicted metal-dependent HD superfamily phosphohydrolase